jgi:hypothetical protein
MKVRRRQRKCTQCKELFHPDPHNRYHQRCCSKPACQKARKAANQRVWAQRPANRDYWRGPHQVERVRQWRRAHPGYGRKPRPRTPPTLQVVSPTQTPPAQPVKPELIPQALQDLLPQQPPWLVGLISWFTDSTLQADILATLRHLVARGREVLDMGSRTPAENHDAQTTPGAGARAPTPTPV